MNVILGRIPLAAFLALGLSSVTLARDAGGQHAAKAPGTRSATAPLHGIGFADPKFRSDLRTTKDQPYTWPVSDRYRPVSQPFLGRSY
jgi:hypothetical protein